MGRLYIFFKHIFRTLLKQYILLTFEEMRSRTKMIYFVPILLEQCFFLCVKKEQAPVKNMQYLPILPV